MPTDWEETFIAWTKPPSDSEELRCGNSVAMVRNAIQADSKLKGKDIRVFAQGSYENNTNVKLNSDVDVCVLNMDTFWADYPPGKTREDFGHTGSDYLFPTFKDQVGIALTNYFIQGHITRGKKAFDIAPNGYRVEADAVPCFEYRKYNSIQNSQGVYTYESGIQFISDEGQIITSWPKQHYQNGIFKNEITATRYKKVVRIFRKLNYVLQENNITIPIKVTGYLLECLCWNVPNQYFSSPPYVYAMRNIISYLIQSTQNPKTVENWTESNQLKHLFGNHQPWNVQEVNLWMLAAWKFIGFQ